MENDFDPFHPSAPLEITSHGGTTFLGRKITVNSDGSFAYSPNSGETAWNVNHAQQVYDSFQYTVNDQWTGTVTIIVDGLAEVPDDVVVSGTLLYDQRVFIVVDEATPLDEDTLISVPAPGLLHNDPAGRIVANTELQYSTTLGAHVTVAPNGAFQYDPMFAVTLQALSEGERAVDTFTYISGTAPGAGGSSVNVSVELVGKNDRPVANDDEFEIDQNAVLNDSNLLDNDTDPDWNDTLSISDFQSLSTEGATVAVHADGTFTYDPTSSATLVSLSRGQILTDTFTYEISDGTTTDVATASINVSGINHSVIATVDGYASDEDSVLSVPADSGLLSNDSDADTTDTLAVIAYDKVSHLGARVAVLENGSFTYDPAGAAAGDSDELNVLTALRTGESLIDAFKYTVSDGHGSQEIGPRSSRCRAATMEPMMNSLPGQRGRWWSRPRTASWSTIP